MLSKKYSRTEIIRNQIDQACILYKQENYISSFTLASVAETIINEILKARGTKSTDDSYIEFCRLYEQSFGRNTPSDQKILRNKNQERNILKHCTKENSEYVVINPKLQAEITISRAIEGFIRLDKSKSEIMNDFCW